MSNINSGKEINWIKKGIQEGKNFHFQTKNPYFHNLLNLSFFLLFLLVIAITVFLGKVTTGWLYVPLAAFIFGWCYFSLMVLVVHEASHGMFIVTKDKEIRRKYNRFFGWLICIPFAIHYQRHWEQGHTVHHHKPLEPDDPQRFNCLTGLPLLYDILLLIFVPGYAFFYRFLTKEANSRQQSSKGLIIAFLIFWTSVSILITLYVSVLSTIALLLGLQVLSAYNQIKGALEHGGAVGFEDNPYLRSRTSLFFGRALLFPFNITLHFEHHLNYTVPWYDLPRYHQKLLASVPEVLQAEIFNHDLWAQLSGKKGGIPEHLRYLIADK